MSSSYQRPTGFHMAKLYPAEGDSAMAELWFGDFVWADVTLGGINLAAVGEDRIVGAHAIVRLCPPKQDGQEWWEFELSDVIAQLEGAKIWLLENERGRTPVEDASGLTRAGSAFSKISEEDEIWQERRRTGI